MDSRGFALDLTAGGGTAYRMPTLRTHKSVPTAFDLLGGIKRLSASDRKRIKAAVEAEIDVFLIAAGVKEPKRLADRRGGRYLPFEKTPAYVCVEELEGELYLRVEAKVMEVPDGRDAIFGLMTKLLQINTTIAGVLRLGVDDGLVIAAGAENLRALNESGLLIQHIEQVVEFAESAQKDLRASARRKAPSRRS